MMAKKRHAPFSLLAAASVGLAGTPTSVVAACAAVQEPAAFVAAMPLSLPEFTALTARCAPTVSPRLLAAVAKTESGLDSWTLHDNTTGVSERPESQENALNDVRAWMARGDSVDIGLMQINSANFVALGMSASTALDPCASLAGGAGVPQAAYGGGATTADQKVVLLMALSRYNTGSPLKGIMNGYARNVITNEGNREISSKPVRSESAAALQLITNSDAPPSWNIAATGAYVESHGAPWLISLGSGRSLSSPGSLKLHHAALSGEQTAIREPPTPPSAISAPVPQAPMRIASNNQTNPAIQSRVLLQASTSVPISILTPATAPNAAGATFHAKGSIHASAPVPASSSIQPATRSP